MVQAASALFKLVALLSKISMKVRVGRIRAYATHYQKASNCTVHKE